ncbi:MAG TPA: 30S ribosome-binding factor RbfA [Methylophilaceae bacterium]|jgi:ribosome-binding factor A
MAKEFSRSQKVAEQIRRELADLLQFEVKDPRVVGATITEVEVTGDLAHAKTFFSTREDAAAALAGLEKAAGFLRSQLAKRLMLRTVPQLHFVHDTSIERGFQLSQLIDKAVSEEKH